MLTVRKIFKRKTAAFFIFVGLVYALGTGTLDIFNLAQIELGLPVKYLGILFGAASLLGAVLGIWVHHLKRLTFKQFAAFDVIINLAPFVAYGIVRSLPLAIAMFILSFAFWRYEQIMYQHYILKIYGTTRYKATLISLTLNFRSFHETWIAFVTTTAARHYGVLSTIGYSSVVIVLLIPLLLAAISQFEANAKAEVASPNQ